MAKSKIQSAVDTATSLAIHALVCGLGGTASLQDIDRARSDAGLTVDTLAGPALLKLYPAERLGSSREVVDPWLHMKFSDPSRAHHCEQVDQQRLNAFSGKYNFMGLDAHQCMVMESALRSLNCHAQQISSAAGVAA